MSLRSILVATDLSAQENIAVERAAQLARLHRAAVKLVYMPPAGEPVPAHAAARLANAARRLHEQLELRVKAAPLKQNQPEDLAAAARCMDLVVLPHRRERSVEAFFLGQPVLRLLRRCHCPVLVTRQRGADAYRRILVAADGSRESDALAKLATGLDDRARLEVFQPVRGEAEPGLQAIAQQQHTAADLVVLAKHRSSAWEDFLCASAAHHVLDWGTSDVLVVPYDEAEARTAFAVRRARRRHVPAAAPVPPPPRKELDARA